MWDPCRGAWAVRKASFNLTMTHAATHHGSPKVAAFRRSLPEHRSAQRIRVRDAELERLGLRPAYWHTATAAKQQLGGSSLLSKETAHTPAQGWRRVSYAKWLQLCGGGRAHTLVV